LYDIGIKDDNGNVIQGDVLAQDTTNTYINASHHMVATLGVDNLVIVDTANATLISTKEKSQEVQKIVKQLEILNPALNIHHSKVHRPWGWFDSIESGMHFQVKRLHVNPGAKLSLQMHHKRAEHWVVVSGVATATNDKKVLTLKKGESTYIPQGIRHSLENKTNEPLEIIEVQSGTYLGEDDIIRFDDIYGREAENN
jgi:mannose-1-phosphate guanylyltransferase/mannose-6-phosphate isomerase